MKKLLLFSLVAACSIVLISWGALGHRTIGRIASRHLSPKAKQSIDELLGSESLADVSTYADDIRSKEEFKYTAPWHYINIPAGYNFEQFSEEVRNMKEDNVYKAVKKCESELKNPSQSNDEKAFALKLIVHFVGDLHQPMHVSHSEDRGGNSINVTFNGQEANLHSLWDSRLIEHQNLNEEQLANQYDHASDAQIKQWQSDDIIKWLYESYQISEQLYADAKSNPNFDEAYYRAHLTFIQQRIEQAGIRLAGLLNLIFNDPSNQIAPISNKPAESVRDNGNIKTGEKLTICEKVYSTRYFDGSQMTLLNLGAEYPNQKLTIMIRGEDRGKFKVAPEQAFSNKNVCVTGIVTNYRGKPEIVVTEPSQIVLKD